MVLTQPGIYPNVFKRHIQRKEVFKVYIGPVPSRKRVAIFAGFSAEMALRGNCRGEVVMHELAGSERTAHAQRQDRQTADAGKAGVTTVRYNSNQEEIGAALYLTEEERKVVFNKVGSGALAERFKVRAKREKHDVNDQPER